MSDHPTAESLKEFMNRAVVLDTEGPILYLGILREVRSDGYWLERVDLRDGREGHVSKERYICEAREHGIKPNRTRVFVFARVVISISALEDVMTVYES
jgi:hypothetical protein